MAINQQSFNALVNQGMVSLLLRINLDLRNSSMDKSQRRINAIELGIVTLIHTWGKRTISYFFTFL